MAFCTKCGHQIDDETKFCPGCGAPIAAPEPEAKPAAQPVTPDEQPAAQSAATDGQQAAPEAAPAGQQEAPKAEPKEKKKIDFNEYFEKINNGADCTADYDAEDIDKNKIVAICSYLGILLILPLFNGDWALLPAIALSIGLLLIPLLMFKTSKFARFHANQGAVLLIAAVAWTGVYGLIHFLINLSIAFLEYAGVFGVLLILLLWLIDFIIALTWIAFPAVAIIGVINVCSGKAKELPIIGKIRLFK